MKPSCDIAGCFKCHGSDYLFHKPDQSIQARKNIDIEL